MNEQGINIFFIPCKDEKNESNDDPEMHSGSIHDEVSDGSEK